MEPDHTFEFVVGNAKPKRTAIKELERAKESAKARGESEDVGFIVSEDTVSKRRGEGQCS